MGHGDHGAWSVVTWAQEGCFAKGTPTFQARAMLAFIVCCLPMPSDFLAKESVLHTCRLSKNQSGSLVSFSYGSKQKVFPSISFVRLSDYTGNLQMDFLFTWISCSYHQIDVCEKTGCLQNQPQLNTDNTVYWNAKHWGVYLYLPFSDKPKYQMKFLGQKPLNISKKECIMSQSNWCAKTHRIWWTPK